MRSIFVHLSSLIGLLVFLSHLWRSAAVEQTVVLAFGAGLAAYAMLVLGYATARRIVRTPAPPAATPADASAGVTSDPPSEAPAA